MAEQGEYLLQRLGEIEQQYESVVDARGLGLMVAIEFKSEEQRDAIIDTALQTGLLTVGCGKRVFDCCLRLTLPNGKLT